MKRAIDIFGRRLASGIFLSALIFCFSTGLTCAQSSAPKTKPSNEQPEELKIPRPLNRNGKIIRAIGRIDFNQPGFGKSQAAALTRAFQELELSDEQKDKIRIVWTQHAEQIRRLVTLRRAKAVIFDDALYSDQFDAIEAEKKAADLAATEGELMKTQMKMILQFRLLLNPEQTAKFRRILEEERQRPLKALPANQ